MHGRFTEQRMRLRAKFPNFSGDILDQIIYEAAQTERQHIEQEIKKVSDDNEQMRGLLSELSEELNIILDSDGISGYHLNGEILEWGATEFPRLNSDVKNVLGQTDK